MEIEPNQDPTHDKGRLYHTLLKAAGVLALAYPLAFFTGWEYTLAFYGWFHVQPWVLDIPAFNYVIAPTYILAPLVLFGLFTILIPKTDGLVDRCHTAASAGEVEGTRRRLCRLATPIWNWLRRTPEGIFTGLLAALVLVAGVAEWKGRIDAAAHWNGALHVQLTFKAPQLQYDSEFLQANNDSRLLLIDQSKDLVVLRIKRKKENISKRDVFVLARADLAALRIWQ